MWIVASEANLRRSALSASLRDVICFVWWAYKGSFFYVFYCNVIFLRKIGETPFDTYARYCKASALSFVCQLRNTGLNNLQDQFGKHSIRRKYALFWVCRLSRDLLKRFGDSRSFSRMIYFGFSLFFSKNSHEIE